MREVDALVHVVRAFENPMLSQAPDPARDIRAFDDELMLTDLVQIESRLARLKKEGFTILLVEQNFRFASTVADRYYIVEHGKIIDGFANSELQANMDKLHTYLGV